MPKKVNLFNLQLSKRPVISTIEYNNSEVYYWYIVGGEGERYRVSSGYTNKKIAEGQARIWEQNLDPAERAKQNIIRKRIAPVKLFTDYITSKENAADKQKIETHGIPATVDKWNTLKNVFEEFLNEFHARPESERFIESGKTIDRIEYFDQITTYWLEHQWRPTWFKNVNGGTFWSNKKRLELLTEIWHYAQRCGYMPSNYRSRNCPCIACNMVQMNRKTDTVDPTPPFTLQQYDMVVEACDKYEDSFDDLANQLRITGQRLRAFIEVMRYCGSRITDTTLMRKDDLLKVGDKYEWEYVPVKNGKQQDPIIIPVPKHVAEQLLALPDAPGFSPEHFFWSGNGLIKNVRKPWEKALTRLFKHCVPDEAKKIDDTRNKQKVIPTSHMFRNTFCVQCRLAGMTYAQIADAIGDTEKMVKDHYSAYCREYDRMVARGVESMQSAVEKMQAASVAPVAQEATA